MSSVRQVADQAEQIADLGARAKFLATAGNPWASPLALAVYALVAVAVGGFALRWILDWQGVSSATAASIAQFTAVCSALAAWISRQSVLARKILKPAESIRSKIKERVDTARAAQLRELGAAQAKEAASAAQLAALTDQYMQASAAVTAAEAERAKLGGQELLRRYLAERAASTDYDQYKGVVALVHHDLEQLSDYLTAALSESADEAGLRRIVLYIDDLDRCDPETVANVLAAVHLLLALPLFTVLVGVDPRWLEKSLEQTHMDLFPDQETGDRSANRHTAPTDYLEKIFQLTYTVPTMSVSGCERLITATLDELVPASQWGEPRGTTAESAARNGPASQSADGLANGDHRNDDRSTKTLSSAVERVVLGLGLRGSDRRAFAQVAPLVATTPRRAKRFLSAYFVIRARVLIELKKHPGSGFENSEGLLMLVALMTGIPSAVKALDNSESMRPETSIGQWMDVLVEEEALPEEEAVRVRAFRGAGGDLASLPLAEVISWWNLARPYATFVNKFDS